MFLKKAKKINSEKASSLYKPYVNDYNYKRNKCK